jgi:hypothetical protein
MTVSWCEFVDFTLIGGKEVSFGMWRYQSFALIVNNDGTQLYKVDTCNGYSDDVSMDTYWKTSRVFSIIAPVLGCLAAILMCVRPRLGKALGGVFVVVTTCQGLVFFLKRVMPAMPTPTPFSLKVTRRRMNSVRLEGMPSCVFSP